MDGMASENNLDFRRNHLFLAFEGCSAGILMVFRPSIEISASAAKEFHQYLESKSEIKTDCGLSICYSLKDNTELENVCEVLLALGMIQGQQTDENIKLLRG
jgi:hypothetical protein